MEAPHVDAGSPEALPGPTAIERALRGVGVLAAIVVIQTLCAMLASLGWRLATGHSPRIGEDSTASLAVIAITEMLVAGVGMAVVAAVRPEGRGLAAWLAPTAASIRPLLPVLVAAVIVPMALLVLTGRPLVADDVTIGRATLLCVLAIAVGIAEEVVFRIGLVSATGGVGAPMFAAACSALLFGVAHLANEGAASAVAVNAVAVALMVGVPFAAVRLVSGSVFGAILVHVAIDVLGLLQLGGFRLPEHAKPAEAAMQLGVAAAVAAGYLRWLRSHTIR